MIELQHVADYLSNAVTDPFQRYILKKEIYREEPTAFDTKAIHSSKWYNKLINEQWEDGSWGRFHSMDSKITAKQKFVTTEAALRRARDLRLTKDDPMIAKAVRYMERIVTGKETWRDHVEKHHDNGKSHLHSRAFLTAANLCLFDSKNPLLKTPCNTCVKQLENSFASGGYHDEIWQKANFEYSGICMRNADCISETLQRQYLSYIWNRDKGIYYISNSPVSKKLCLEDKGFTAWLSALEVLSGFTLFPEFMEADIYSHLLSEIARLMNEEVRLPPSHPIMGHYAENWRDKNARKNDMLLRILSVLVKCGTV